MQARRRRRGCRLGDTRACEVLEIFDERMRRRRARQREHGTLVNPRTGRQPGAPTDEVEVLAPAAPASSERPPIALEFDERTSRASSTTSCEVGRSHTPMAGKLAGRPQDRLSTCEGQVGDTAR